MARNLGLDEVVDHFTLVGDEVDQLRNKTGRARLGAEVPALAGPVPAGAPRAARRRGGARRPAGGRGGERARVL